MSNKRFSIEWIREETREDGSHGFFFAFDLLDEFADIFSHCENNIDVEDELKNAGVVKKSDKCGSGGVFRVIFDTSKHGDAFLQRLNSYLNRMSQFSSSNSDGAD